MNTIEKLNEILSVSRLPSEIDVHKEFEVAFLLTYINDSDNSGYIPNELMALLNDRYKNSFVWLHDSEPKTDNHFKFVDFGGHYQKFQAHIVDDLLEETGLWGFVIEFEKDGTFLVGLDQEYVMIVSHKRKGLIQQSGGKRVFWGLLERCLST